MLPQEMVGRWYVKLPIGLGGTRWVESRDEKLRQNTRELDDGQQEGIAAVDGEEKKRTK